MSLKSEYQEEKGGVLYWSNWYLI